MKNQNKGKEDLGKIIGHLIDNNIRFDYINGVLSSRKLPKGVEGLWFWFGNLLVAEEGLVRAGEMKVLDSWTFDKEHNFVIINTCEAD